MKSLKVDSCKGVAGFFKEIKKHETSTHTHPN